MLGKSLGTRPNRLAHMDGVPLHVLLHGVVGESNKSSIRFYDDEFCANSRQVFLADQIDVLEILFFRLHGQG